MKSVRSVGPKDKSEIRFTTRSGAVYSVGAGIDSSGAREIKKSDGQLFIGKLGVALRPEAAANRMPTMNGNIWVSTSPLPDGRVIIEVDEIKLGDCLGIVFRQKGSLSGAGSSPITKIEIG